MPLHSLHPLRTVTYLPPCKATLRIALAMPYPYIRFNVPGEEKKNNNNSTLIFNEINFHTIYGFLATFEIFHSIPNRYIYIKIPKSLMQGVPNKKEDTYYKINKNKLLKNL